MKVGKEGAFITIHMSDKTQRKIKKLWRREDERLTKELNAIIKAIGGRINA